MVISDGFIDHPIRQIYPSKKKEIVVVHLGNYGYGRDDGEKIVGDQAKKTAEYSKRFKKSGEIGITNIKFYGIDAARFEKNGPYVQICADFIRGLDMFSDGSIAILSSDMALGYYGSHEFIYENPLDIYYYTQSLMKRIYNKLKPNGLLYTSIGEKRVDGLVKIIDEANFRKVNVRIFNEIEYSRTFWTNWIRHSTNRWAINEGRNLYQISARK
jgi:hypothetical protein